MGLVLFPSLNGGGDLFAGPKGLRRAPVWPGISPSCLVPEPLWAFLHIQPWMMSVKNKESEANWRVLPRVLTK